MAVEIHNAEFLIGATKPEHFPASKLPEAAFIGRSNVGKSSLLNSIVRRKNLAHVSGTPGKTQQINFFGVQHQWMFADLPGFGFAKASLKDRAQWKGLANAYLGKREQLKIICLLLDSRHDPSPLDLGMIEELEEWGRRYAIILTKKDKISPTAVSERTEQIRELTQLCAGCVDVLPYSSVTNDTRANLLAILKRELAL
jgi:GTP-binding protein